MTNSRAMELLVQGRDVPWLLDQWVQRTPHKTFLIWAPPQGDHRQWTYAEFDQEVQRLSDGLKRRGLKSGQRLLIHMENCPEYLFAYFACARLGVISVLTNTRCVEREMEYFCENTGITAAITQPHYLELIQTAAPDLKFIAVTNSQASGASVSVGASISGGASVPAGADISAGAALSAGADVSAGEGSNLVTYNDLIMGSIMGSESLIGTESSIAHNADNAASTPRQPEPMADLRIQFTSGTTSRPKAVLSTHANAIYAAQQTALAYGLTKEDICQLCVPLFHNQGLSTLVTSALWAGGCVVLQPKFSVSNFWKVALKYRATWTSLPGAFFINALWSQPVPEHYFRFWIVGVVKAIEEKFNVQSRGHWGMTEMVTLPLVGDPHHAGPDLNIGRPIPGIELSIRNANGDECGPGETGKLYVRGVRGISIFKEYVNNPEANAAAFDDDGWFNTGDRVRIGENGDLFFGDREKNMLRVGGENVASSEIESVIRQLPWVKECAVVGQKHNMLDEVPVAFVMIDPGHAPAAPEEAVIAHCRQQLADFKVVRQVTVVDDFPRSTLQKIAKHKLSEGLPVLEC